jgi:hypothetical protein
MYGDQWGERKWLAAGEALLATVAAPIGGQVLIGTARQHRPLTSIRLSTANASRHSICRPQSC